jgi:hypothetical protein
MKDRRWSGLRVSGGVNGRLASWNSHQIARRWRLVCYGVAYEQTRNPEAPYANATRRLSPRRRVWIDPSAYPADRKGAGITWENRRRSILSRDVAGQAERLMKHGWSIRGLFGWPSGLAAQAYLTRSEFTGLFSDGGVKMTSPDGEKTVIKPVHPEAAGRLPWEA